MAASQQQFAHAVSPRSVQGIRDAVAGALSAKNVLEVKEHTVHVDPGPNFPRAVPTIPGLQAIALGPSLEKTKQEKTPEKTHEEKQGDWHVVTSEGAAAVGKHHELLQRVANQEKVLPEIVLVHGNPDDDSQGESIRIRLCNPDGEPTSLEDLELEEIPDVVPFVDHTDPLTRLIDAWPDLDESTQNAILLLVRAAG